MSSDLAVCYPGKRVTYRHVLSQMLHEEFPVRISVTVTPRVCEISAVTSFWTDRKFARKSIGKSCNGFVRHVQQIGTIKTLSSTLSLYLPLSYCGQKGFINQFSRYNARLCLEAKTWFNSAHNCSPGIAESPRVRINTRRSASLCRVCFVLIICSAFWLVRVLRHNRQCVTIINYS